MDGERTWEERLAGVRRLLAGHRPADAREAAHVEQVGRLLDQGARAFRRDHYAPGHLTASGFVLDGAHRRVLLVHHRRLGLWLQPGGHVEPSDADLLAAARREVAEETGLVDLEPWPGLLDVDVHRIPAARGEPEHLHHDLRFLFTARSGRPAAGDGVRAVRWVALEDVRDAGSDGSVLRAVARIRRLLEDRGGR